MEMVEADLQVGLSAIRPYARSSPIEANSSRTNGHRRRSKVRVVFNAINESRAEGIGQAVRRRLDRRFAVAEDVLEVAALPALGAERGFPVVRRTLFEHSGEFAKREGAGHTCTACSGVCI